MPEQDDEAGELDEAQVIVRMIFIANDQAAKVVEPGKQALSFPAALEAAARGHPECAGRADGLGGAVRSSRWHLSIQLVAVVSFVPNQPLGNIGDEALLQGPAHQLHFSSAIPARNILPVLNDSLFEADQDLFQINHLNTEAMASLSIYLDQKIDAFPSEHINLLNSRFALTLIDVSQRWPGLEGTVLNVIASDMDSLRGTSDDYARAQIVDELTQCLPFLRTATISRHLYQRFRRTAGDERSWRLAFSTTGYYLHRESVSRRHTLPQSYRHDFDGGSRCEGC